MKFAKERGFTLLELMLVVAIVGILIAVSAPKLNSTKSYFELNSSARACVMDLRYAQQLSIDTKSIHGVFFSDTQYTIKNLDTLEVVKRVSLGNGVKYNGIQGQAEDQVIFGSSGEPLESDMATQYTTSLKIAFLNSADNTNVYIYVTPKTGEVSTSWN